MAKINLRGFVSEEEVITEAILLWKGLKLAFTDQPRPRWKWSHRTSFAGQTAQPYNDVLRQRGIGPEELYKLSQSS